MRHKVLDFGGRLPGFLTRGVVLAVVITIISITYLATSVRRVWAADRQTSASGAPSKAPERSAAEAVQKFVGTWREDSDQFSTRETLNPNPPADAPPLPPPPAPPPPGANPQQITWSGDVLKISGGKGTYTYTIKLDGSEVRDPASTSSSSVRVARSHLEKGKIITDWKMLRDGRLLIEGQDIRSLSDDGNRQVVDTLLRSPWGEREIHRVMVRKR